MYRAADAVFVGEMVASSSCTHIFEKGERYLIYASDYRNGLQMGACGRTAPLASADKDIEALGLPEDHLTDTGGLPHQPAGALLAAAATLVFARALFVRVVRVEDS